MSEPGGLIASQRAGPPTDPPPDGGEADAARAASTAGDGPRGASDAAHTAVVLSPEVYVKKRRSLLRRFAVLIAGSLVILVAVIIGPLPGPGPVILIPVGLAILATEFEWARRLLERFKSGATDLSEHTDRLTGMVSRVWILPVVAVYWFLVWQAVREWPSHEDMILIAGFSSFIPVAWVCYRIAVIRARTQPLRRLWRKLRERRRAGGAEPRV